MHPLLLALAAWPGRPATKSLLELRGYWLPQRYKEVVLANCGDCDEVALDRYWDEVALEYFCSAGRVRSDQRLLSETSYRSGYLDDLASSATNRDPASRGLPLDGGLRAFTAKAFAITDEGTLHAQRIAEQMEECKRIEIDKFSISGGEWTGTKSDFANFLGKVAEARGFLFKTKTWRKAFGALEFCCGVDVGMRVTWSVQLPLIFEIIHTAAPDLVFHASFSDALMPGFNYYTMYRSPESAILGILAHVDLFETIGELIVSHPRSAS